jgi:NTE family protein
MTKRVNLVLSGTGALYPAHAGAVQALLDLGYSFKAVSGTSGGAILALAIASQHDFNRTRRILIDYDPWPRLMEKFTLPFKNGWGFYDNQACLQMYDWLGGNITFKDVPIPIHIVATQVVPKYKRFIFNKENTPDLTLSEAVRISSAIPILFKSITIDGKILTDGTFADNLYIEPFEDDFENTIALELNVCSTSSPRSFWEYVKLSLSMLITGQGSGKYSPKGLTFIPLNIYQYMTPLRFRLSRNDRKKLYNAGYQAVIQYFEGVKENEPT